MRKSRPAAVGCARLPTLSIGRLREPGLVGGGGKTAEIGHIHEAAQLPQVEVHHQRKPYRLYKIDNLYFGCVAMHNEDVNDPQDKRMTLSTVSSLLIRPCEEADIPAITEIYRDAVLHGRASFEIDPPDVETMAERRRLLVEGNYPYLVAECDGTIAGYAYAGAYRARPAYGATLEDSVYIDPAMKGMGIGRKLLDALIAEATARGFRQMIAVIGDSANAASVGVHRAAGFELVGTFKSIGWKHGQWLDTVLMQRSLGEGDTTPRF